MPMIEGVRFCDGCGAEVVGAPVVLGPLQYCCLDCSEGRECDCALVFEDDRHEAGAEAESF